MFRTYLSIIYVILFSMGSFANARECGIQKTHVTEKTRVLDIVFAPGVDPTNSKFIVDIGGSLVPIPPLPSIPFPAGSHFIFSALVYPGHTFSTTEPFTNLNSIKHLNQVIGTYVCSGSFDQETFAFQPPGNEDIGNTFAILNLNSKYPSTSPKSIQTIIMSYTARSVNPFVAGTGNSARIEEAVISGGTGLNKNIRGTALLNSYLDQQGNLLIRLKFDEKVILPPL